jgi:hypothetical protein
MNYFTPPRPCIFSETCMCCCMYHCQGLVSMVAGARWTPVIYMRLPKGMENGDGTNDGCSDQDPLVWQWGGTLGLTPSNW